MAKKKSKVGKQQQKKAKSLTKKRKQIASLYSLPKNNDNSGNNHNSNGKTPHNSPMNANGGKFIGEKRKLRKNIKFGLVHGNATAAAKKTIDQEKDDFIHEYNSLQERTFQQQQLQQKGTIIDFTKPTFEINQQLTTDELIIQTTSQLNQQYLLNPNHHNGGDMSSSTINDNKTLLQRLAAEKEKELRMQMLFNNHGQNQAAREEEQNKKQNSFWAFQDDDDSDDERSSMEINNTKTNNSVSCPFSFASPSFVVPSNTSVSNNVSHSNQLLNSDEIVVGEDDPDL